VGNRVGKIRTTKNVGSDLTSDRVCRGIARALCSSAEEDISDMQEDEAMTCRAIKLLGSKRNDAYEAALTARREDTQAWWADVLVRNPVNADSKVPKCAEVKFPSRRG
jgi:hypothetical protein